MKKLKSDRLSHLANNPTIFPTEKQKQAKKELDKEWKTKIRKGKK